MSSVGEHEKEFVQLRRNRFHEGGRALYQAWGMEALFCEFSGHGQGLCPWRGPLTPCVWYLLGQSRNWRGFGDAGKV